MQKQQSNRFRLTAVIAAALLIAACASTGKREGDIGQVKLHHAPTEMVEERLLDVGIALFEPGPISEKEKEIGLLPEIRKAESRYIPIHLKSTVAKSGYWGPVRIVPVRENAVDVEVRGEILESNGQSLAIKVSARDSTGRLWFDKPYRTHIDQESYFQNGSRSGDPFQSLYNAIANDLSEQSTKLTPDQIREIRRVSSLRFATYLAPRIFAGYLEKGAENRYKILRLPAQDSPMMMRVDRIRERDYMLIDTINGYYDNFYTEMREPYMNWRRFHSADVEELQRLDSDMLVREVVGITAIIGAIAIEVLGGDGAAEATMARNAALFGGGVTLASALELNEEKEKYKGTLRELGTSFETSLEPMVVEVEGETIELTGTAEHQYANWRKLLQRIYASEAGIPLGIGEGGSEPSMGP